MQLLFTLCKIYTYSRFKSFLNFGKFSSLGLLYAVFSFMVVGDRMLFGMKDFYFSKLLPKFWVISHNILVNNPKFRVRKFTQICQNVAQKFFVGDAVASPFSQLLRHCLVP